MKETRNITQVKIFKLILNPMMSNTENGTMVAVAYEKNKLIEWYNQQIAEEAYYTIGDNYFPAKGDFPANEVVGHKYHKVFKQHGPLEWYNPADLESLDHYGHGIQSEWVNEEIFENFVNRGGNGAQLIL